MKSGLVNCTNSKATQPSYSTASAKIGLILSNDWEIFGNGRGDFYSIQYEPTNQLIKVCERHGAKLTLMAEVGQQWAHEKLAESHPWAEEVAKSWKNQARDAIARGHDVQLHLHPQWIYASHDGDNWVLDYDHYSLTSFSIDEATKIITSAKKYLENLLSGLDENYECIAFRAGNFMVDPSDKYLRSIAASGIKCDTTVCKGQHLRNNLGSYDYRQAPSRYRPWWISKESLNQEDDGSRKLVEFPILSEPYSESRAGRRIIAKLAKSGAEDKFLQNRPVYRLALERFRTNSQSYRRHQENLAIRRARYPDGGLPTRRSFGVQAARIADFVWRRSSLMLDYDNLMPGVAAAMVVNIYEKLQDRKFDGYIPIVAIGHVKNMVNTDYMDEFLTLISSELGDALTFQTLAEAYAMWFDNQAPHPRVQH